MLLDVIKYGTSVLTTEQFDGGSAIDHNVMSQHGKIIDQHDDPIILVSSGAVGFGKIAMNQQTLKETDETTVKRILAQLGQPELMKTWDKYIPGKKVLQMLVTYYDLRRRDLKKQFRLLSLTN